MHQCYTNYAKQISTKYAAWKRWSRLHRIKRGLTIRRVEGIANQIVSMLQEAIQQLTSEKVMVIAIQIVSVLQGAIRIPVLQGAT